MATDRELQWVDRQMWTIGPANTMVACCVSDCNVIDDETGEVVAECGDILVADDLERILALNATYLVTDGWQCTARRRTYERGSSDILAALCNLVLLIALVVFLLCVAPRLGLRLNLDWVAGLVGW